MDDRNQKKLDMWRVHAKPLIKPEEITALGAHFAVIEFDFVAVASGYEKEGDYVPANTPAAKYYGFKTSDELDLFLEYLYDRKADRKDILVLRVDSCGVPQTKVVISLSKNMRS